MDTSPISHNLSPTFFCTAAHIQRLANLFSLVELRIRTSTLVKLLKALSRRQSRGSISISITVPHDHDGMCAERLKRTKRNQGFVTFKPRESFDLLNGSERHGLVVIKLSAHLNSTRVYLLYLSTARQVGWAFPATAYLFVGFLSIHCNEFKFTFIVGCHHTQVLPDRWKSDWIEFKLSDNRKNRFVKTAFPRTSC